MPPSLRYLIPLLLVTLKLQAQPSARFEGTPTNISPHSVLWLIDSSGEKGWPELAKVPFGTFPKGALLTAKTQWHVWTHFYLENGKSTDQELVLTVPQSGFATAYVHTGDTAITLQTGSLLPLQSRSLRSNANGFLFTLKAGQGANVWVRLQSIYSSYLPRHYGLQLSSLAQFEGTDKDRLLGQGIFLGVILIMILYNLLIGLAVKDTSYLYYVLSLVGLGTYFAFYYGFGLEYLWPQRPVWNTFCYLLIVPFTGLMRLLFTRTYLHTASLLPNTHFVGNILIGLNVLVLLSGTAAYLFRFDAISFLVDMIGVTGTAIHLFMLIAGIIAYREKFRPAKYFIWANLVIVTGAVLFIGRELGVLPDNFVTRYLVQIGLLIQVVVFSLGLASRLNGMRDQLTKELLEKERLALEREKEKKALIEAQRRELLQQVEQQTRDLKEKNGELERSFTLVKRSEARLTQLNEVKNKLFSVISHDLRNPLATMQSFLKLLTEHHHKLSEGEKQQLYAQAQASLDNLNILLYNLLQWSRSQMNLLEHKWERLAVGPLLENAVKVLQLHAHMKNISVKVLAEEDLYGLADKEMTEFVVRNLLSNAIKFSHRNGEVVVRAFRSGGAITIEVTDTGIGMSEARIKKLLEMNAALSRRGTEKEKGTGLGLLICKEFIEKNRGTLSICSEPGKGSAFSFTIVGKAPEPVIATS